MIAAPSRALIIRRLLRVINHMVKKLEREMALASTKVGTPEAAVLGRLVTALGKLIDLEMLVMTQGGRERTAPEWTGLLAEGGFRLDRIVPTRSPACVIESTRV